jgi:hypothetical protein
MPILPKHFGRRKSTANALEDLENAPVVAGSSFRVLERPREGNKSFDGGVNFARSLTAPMPPKKDPPQRKPDNMFEDLSGNRYVRLFMKPISFLSHMMAQKALTINVWAANALIYPTITL